jgi:hypothetical protein
MIFQCLHRGDERIPKIQENYEFDECSLFERTEYPEVFFVEERHASDPTNWFLPNESAVEAMLRSSGFRLMQTRNGRFISAPVEHAMPWNRRLPYHEFQCTTPFPPFAQEATSGGNEEFLKPR